MREYKRIFGYLARYKKHVFLAFFSAAAGSLGLVAATYLSGVAIDQMPAEGGVRFSVLWKILLVLFVVYSLSALFQWWVGRGANQVAYCVVRDLRVEAFSHLARVPISFCDAHPHGELTSRLTNDLEAVSDGLSVLILNLFWGSVTVISCVVVMLCLNLVLACTVMGVTSICALFAVVIGRACRRFFRKQQESVGKISAFVYEWVGNQKTVQAFSQESEEKERFFTLTEELRKTATRAVFGSAIINPGTRFVNSLAYITVALVGSILAIRGMTTVGMLTSFLIYAGQFARPFNEISGITAQLQTASAAMQRIFALIDHPLEPSELEDALTLVRNEGRIAFEGVYFSYQPGEPILKDVNFRARPGQLIALVGPTGCGKTTLVNLLMRFYEIDRGTITLDGIDIRAYTKKSLRRSFGMVLQESWMFSGSVAQNIAYGNPRASRDQIILAAKKAHAHSFIRRLPQGYNTLVEEQAFSEGERQLLTIARAMLVDPPVLILDEATSSIDPLTEWRVQKAFQKLMAGRTSLVIAHRLSTIQSADCILVMQDGRIVERGRHSDLLAQGGLYAQMYQSQFAQGIEK